MNLLNRIKTLLFVLPFLVISLGGCASNAAMSVKSIDHCRSCHDLMGAPHLATATSHSDFACKECHQHSLSKRFHKRGITADNLKKELASLAMDEIHLSEQQVFSVHKRCAECHETQFNDWQASQHTMTYAGSFLDAAHNKMEQPINDCLRCHAMFFEGAIEDLVTPLNNKGPWKLKKSDMTRRNSILCVSCHQIHPAEPVPNALQRYASMRISTPQTNSVFTGFYDRREKTFFNLDQLPHPKIYDDKSAVKMSADTRIRNCYQCHAPSASHAIGASDDKTPIGVHAGLSCFDCHETHRLSAANSCAKCHPAVSHCKIDVKLMDTSLKNRSSKHNIHTVACKDCHPNNPPK